jgi:phage tail-like protein
VSFSYRVDIEGAESDTSFQEVSGLKVELTVEPLPEGGQNRYVHQLPTGTKYSNLVLKRGVVTTKSPFGRWLQQAMSLGPVRQEAKTIVVHLLDEARNPLIVWKVFGAYPLSWDHSALNSTGNEVLSETIELSYRFFQRETGRGGQSRAA